MDWTKRRGILECYLVSKPVIGQVGEGKLFNFGGPDFQSHGSYSWKTPSQSDRNFQQRYVVSKIATLFLESPEYSRKLSRALLNVRMSLLKISCICSFVSLTLRWLSFIWFSLTLAQLCHRFAWANISLAKNSYFSFLCNKLCWPCAVSQNFL